MSSPEDLLTACATSREERQRLTSRANDALSLWDNWLHPFTSGPETGDDPAYDDNFQLMREEINKLSGTDSALLCQLAQKCLCECAKDIRVVTGTCRPDSAATVKKGCPRAYCFLSRC